MAFFAPKETWELSNFSIRIGIKSRSSCTDLFYDVAETPTVTEEKIVLPIGGKPTSRQHSPQILSPSVWFGWYLWHCLLNLGRFLSFHCSAALICLSSRPGKGPHQRSGFVPEPIAEQQPGPSDPAVKCFNIMSRKIFGRCMCVTMSQDFSNFSYHNLSLISYH